MRDNRFINTMLLIIINGLVSIYFILFYKYISSSFSIYLTFSWLDQNTKKFFGSAMVLFIILMLTYKFQLKIIEKIIKVFPWLIPIFKYTYIILLSAMLSVVTSFFLEYFQMLKNPAETITWILGDTHKYFAGTLFLFIIYLFIFSLIGNLYISSIITTILLIGIGYIHYNKLNIRVEPLYPSDFSQVSQMKDVIPMLKEYLSVTKLILIIIFLGIIFYLVKFIPKLKSSIWVRIIILISTSVLVYSLTFYQSTFMKGFVQKSNVQPVIWNQLDNYSKNGFIFGFLSNLQNEFFDEPDGYTKENVIATAEKYVNSQKAKIDSKDGVKPNIVYYMSEAFWDPTRLPNVEFNEDPMINLRSLMRQYSSGYNLSPSFGGATANVEFEALTGFTNYFLRVGATPYQDIIDKKIFIPTIVSDLEDKGYNSVAIHPYNKVFYKRNKVYQIFGFDQFLDMDTMKNKKKSGIYISDESLTKEIIDQLKTKKRPMFVHAVSMQNHWDYFGDRYKKNTINTNGLAPDLKEKLDVYSEGVKQADKALQLLVDSLQHLDEPTIVVFWGDHMPVLGPDLAVYKAAKFGETPNQSEYEKLYSETPLLIYSNYALGKEQLNDLSPSYFGPTVYKMAGLKNPPFYNLLNKLKEELPGLKSTVQINGKQQYVTNNLTNKQKKLLKDYELLEYDLLIGKQYSKDLLFKK
jgi:phosphoglycerol transferase MdoB-like AlkP superfamily enzyme